MPIKNSSDIRNRTRNLPACSAVPQTTATQRTPLLGCTSTFMWLIYFYKQIWISLIVLTSEKMPGLGSGTFSCHYLAFWPRNYKVRTVPLMWRKKLIRASWKAQLMARAIVSGKLRHPFAPHSSRVFLLWMSQYRLVKTLNTEYHGI